MFMTGLAIVGGLCVLGETAWAEPPGEIVVTAFGAVGDGQADDTAAFQKALAGGMASGAVVRVPPGRYRLTHPLELGAQSLVGAPEAAWVADDVSLPTLLPEAADGPCIRMKGGASVSGLHFFYDWKNEPPSARPPALELAGTGCRVSEVKIHGAWDGIMADGVSNIGRAHIEHCFLVDIHHVGVRLTGTWDVSWLSKIEVWSPGSQTFPKDGIGFLLGKNDMLMLSDCFVFNAHRAYSFQDRIEGSTIEGGSWGTMSNCAADLSSFGLVFEGEHMMSITGGTYWTHRGGLTVEQGETDLRLSGAELRANGAPAVQIRGGRAVILSACRFRRNFPQYEAPALSVRGGKSVAITGCIITSTSEVLDVAEAGPGLVMTGNIVRGHEASAETDGGQVESRVNDG